MFSKITSYQKRSEKQWIDVSVTSDQALMLAMQTEDNIRFKVGDQWVYAGLKAHSYHNSKKSEKYDFRIGNHHFCNAEWIILHYGKSATKMFSTHKMQAKDLKAILADKLSAENKVFTIERMFSYDQTGRICPLNKNSVIEFTKDQALYPVMPVKAKKAPKAAETNIGGEIAIECYDQGLYTWINLHGYTIDNLPSSVLIAFKETFSIDLTFSTKQQKFYAKKLIAHQDIREFFARIGYKNPDASKPEIQQAEVVTERAEVVSKGAMTAEQKLNILTNGLASLLQSLQAA